MNGMMEDQLSEQIAAEAIYCWVSVGRRGLEMNRSGMALVVALTIALSFSLTGSASAHEHHKATKQVPGARSDSTREPAIDSVGGRADTSEATKQSSAPFELPPVRDALFDHIHNKVIHFPIVLSVVSLAGLLFGRRSPGLLRFALILAWASALTAGAAILSGLYQAAPVYDGEPKAWLVLVHRNWGIATAIGLTITALLAQWGRTRRHAWLAGLLAVALVGVTAFLGGLVSHG